MPTITVAVGRWKFQLRLNLGSTRLPPMADETGRRHHEKYNRHLFLKIQTHSGEQIRAIIHLICWHRFSSPPFRYNRCFLVGHLGMCSKRPMTHPPYPLIFGKSYCNFVLKSPVWRSKQNLQYNFLDCKRSPPLEHFRKFIRFGGTTRPLQHIYDKY